MKALIAILIAVILGVLGAWYLRSKPAQEKAEEPVKWPEIRGYAKMEIPADNPMSRAKVELGRQLYYDTRLSGDGSRSCYACHLAEHGLMDGRATAVGAYEAALPRRSPTLWNIGYHHEFYWDGRSASLEKQGLAAWTGGNMGVSGKDGRPSAENICKKLDAVAGYRKQFQEVFGAGCTPENAMKAVSAFERTIVTTGENSAWIRFREGNQAAFSEAARRGYQVFTGNAKCTNCHDGLLITDLQYHNVGIGWDPKTKKLKDEGRFKVTSNERDTGAFKTPTLLDVARRTHFFHDGSVAKLEDAVDLMLAGGIKNPHLDKINLEPRKLTKEEREDLLAFLRALNSEYTIKAPALPQ